MPIHPGLISCRTLLAWPIKQPLPLSHLVYKSLCPTPDLFAHKIIAKWRKRPHSCKPPPCSPRSYIPGSEAITAPPPSNDNTKLFLTTRLLPSLQFLRKLLKNSTRYIQSSSSPLPHHPNFTSVIHRRFGSDNSASTIHRQHQMIPHHQTIAPISILVEIA